MINLAAFLGLLLLTAGTPLHAETTTWDGSAANWNEAHWDNGVPQVGDDVVISSGTVTLSNVTPNLSSLTMGGGVLSFTNWSTKLTATTVTINSGTVTHVPNSDTNAPWTPNARVWIVCTNLAVNGGSIDVDSMGYLGGATTAMSGSGPGAGLNVGGGASAGSHGGFGGAGMLYNLQYHNSLPYDSATAPVEPGSGGAAGGAVNAFGGNGGGVVRIEADHVTVNGAITANGGSAAVAGSSGGAGGSIYISCKTFAGTNGTIIADGGKGGTNQKWYCGRGGGGRISVDYDTGLQQADDVQSVLFSVKTGGALQSWDVGEKGDLGTLYFPDTALLGETVDHLNGQLVGVTAWSPSSLTVSNVYIRFPEAGASITVAGDLTITGSDGQLQIGGTRVKNLYHVAFFGEPQLISLQVGGNMVLTNGGLFTAYAGVTNASTDGYGALVDVTGDLSLSSNSIFAVHSDPTNGGSVLVSCENFTLAQGATIDASGKGWAWGDQKDSTGSGWGPGGGQNYNHGGTYGGRDGEPGGLDPYGSSNAPALPGSGGGGYVWGPGGYGGGLVRIDAGGNAVVNGTVNADGGVNEAWPLGTAGGSGGGILLLAQSFSGSGILTADGGNGRWNASGGGGGRIATWYGSYTEAERTKILNGEEDQILAAYYALGETTFSGSASVEGGFDIFDNSSTGEVGTVVFRYYVTPPSGTVILIQ